MGLIFSRYGFSFLSISLFSTCAWDAASYTLSSKMSQPVKTRSFKSAKGTKSLISGELLSVRLPSRMVPICVSEPIGFASPRRTASTPEIIVVATAPMPTTITPNFPFAGATFVPAVSRPTVEDKSAPGFATRLFGRLSFSLPLLFLTFLCS